MTVGETCSWAPHVLSWLADLRHQVTGRRSVGAVVGGSARRFRVEPVLIGFVSVWETLALLTHRLPTVTATVLKLPRPGRVMLTAAVGAWLVKHFKLFDE